jgi:redox-sensitive bicupin YhaK (pirin superfamily)
MTLTIPPRTQNIGFPVRRLLPSQIKKMVGPFIFVDHMGPALFEKNSTQGDVRQHPHIGLATVTYLFSGAMMHRDSLGIVQRIIPGDINLMTAGSGIVHSERIPEDIRTESIAVEGMQVWLALPTDLEESAADFAHYSSADIPDYQSQDITARILIGAAWGKTSPVKTASVTTYLDIQLAAGASYRPEFPGQEVAIYSLDNALLVNGEPAAENHLLVLEEQTEITATASSRFILLGGEPLADERFILWNFVASSREKLQQAAARWEQNQFQLVPGEIDKIPLPK